MRSVEWELETSLPPERVRAALLDFTDARPEIWPSLSRELYEVDSVGETDAVIKEGTKMPLGQTWIRQHYDWSDPQIVRYTAQESNMSVVPRRGSRERAGREWLGD